MKPHSAMVPLGRVQGPPSGAAWLHAAERCVCVCVCVCVQHWPEAWLPGAKNDILGEVTMDDQVTREQTW